MIISLLFICLIIFLFLLYVLSRDDFVFVRKGISQERIFNIGLVAVGVGLLFSRLFYVFGNFDPFFLNPLVFLAFPYFPGLSLPGGVLGGGMVIGYYTIFNKLPIGRIFDLFAIAAFFSIPVGMIFVLLYKFLTRQEVFYFSIIFALVYFVLAAFSVAWYAKASFKDGGLAFFFLFSSGVLSLGQKLFEGIKEIFILDNILFFSLALISLTLFIYREWLTILLKGIRK